jgi:hypothetical protein
MELMRMFDRVMQTHRLEERAKAAPFARGFYEVKR